MNAKTIYNNRLAFAKRLINRDVFSLDVYAKYFEIPKSEALKDLSAIGIKDPVSAESENPVSLELLIGKRTQILNKAGHSAEELGNLGFWYEPSNKIAEYSSPIEAAINYYQTERGIKNPYSVDYSTIAKTFQFTADEREQFTKTISENGILKYDERMLQDKRTELETLLKNSATNEVAVLTGIHPSKLLEVSRTLSQKYIDIHSDLFVDHKPNKDAYRKQELMAKVWQMYNQHGSTHGMTQKEIAQELGLTRETISHYITAYKKQHPEVIDVTQLYQPHHLGKEKTEQRELKKQKVATAYRQGFKIEQISKYFNISRDTVTAYLKEDGLIVAHANTGRNQKRLDQASKNAKVGYEEKGQFGSYRINVEGKNTLFHGATSRILNDMGAPAYSTNFTARTRMRDKVLNNQRETMAMLRNDPETLNQFIANNGDAKAIISAQELVARRKALQEDSINEYKEETKNLVPER